MLKVKICARRRPSASSVWPCPVSTQATPALRCTTPERRALRPGTQVGWDCGLRSARGSLRPPPGSSICYPEAKRSVSSHCHRASRREWATGPCPFGETPNPLLFSCGSRRQARSHSSPLASPAGVRARQRTKRRAGVAWARASHEPHGSNPAARTTSSKRSRQVGLLRSTSPILQSLRHRLMATPALRCTTPERRALRPGTQVGWDCGLRSARGSLRPPPGSSICYPEAKRSVSSHCHRASRREWATGPCPFGETPNPLLFSCGSRRQGTVSLQRRVGLGGSASQTGAGGAVAVVGN